MAPSIRDGCDEEVRGHADARDDLEGPNDGRLPGESSARDGQRERFKTEGTRHECGASPRSPSLPALSEEAVEGAGHETSEDVQRVREEQAASLVQVEVPFPSFEWAHDHEEVADECRHGDDEAGYRGPTGAQLATAEGERQHKPWCRQQTQRLGPAP